MASGSETGRTVDTETGPGTMPSDNKGQAQSDTYSGLEKSFEMFKRVERLEQETTAPTADESDPNEELRFDAETLEACNFEFFLIY